MNLDIPFEFKAGGGRTFKGHGSIFGNVDLGGDIVMPGAFNKSLKANDDLPLMAWMHDITQIPGAWRKVAEDERGLAVEGELAKTQLGEDARTLMKMGAIKGLSIGYTIQDFDFDRDGNRLLRQVDAKEISIVSMPMNPAAVVSSVKSIMGTGSLREREAALRDAGFSRTHAKSLLSTSGTLEGGAQDVLAMFEEATRDNQLRKYLEIFA